MQALTDNSAHMNLILFDSHRETLYPLSLTRPVGAFRMGILTLAEKWEKRLQTKASYLTQPYLAGKYPLQLSPENTLVNANILATDQLSDNIRQLSLNQALMANGLLVAVKLSSEQTEQFPAIDWEPISRIETTQEVFELKFPEQVFAHNAQQIKLDYELITQNRQSAPLPEGVMHCGQHQIFIEPGAKIGFATLDAGSGPIYIGANAHIHHGAMLIGPIALCEHAEIKMGAKVYSGSTFGPYCKVGGETNNVVLFGFSNKAHDGYLGNAVLGEWCNLGADTNNSNLKNDYGPVRIWDYTTERFRHTGLQFCGTIMGDHSKTAINTMLNTGTVIGVFANIFGEGFPRQFIPSFAWGGHAGFSEYKLSKAFQTAETVMARRSLNLTEADKQILTQVFEITKRYRRF